MRPSTSTISCARWTRSAIDLALISPPEGNLPVRNREGNELVAADGRRQSRAGCSPTPLRRRGSATRRSRSSSALASGGARALKLDPALQGIRPSRRQRRPARRLRRRLAGWPVYVRTGTPPHSLPLQVAWLASRFPEGRFVLGKSGATDFSHDGPAALAAAPNVYADSSHVEWPTALAAGDPDGAGGRVVFTTDAPFADAARRAGARHRGAAHRGGARGHPRRHDERAARAVSSHHVVGVESLARRPAGARDRPGQRRPRAFVPARRSARSSAAPRALSMRCSPRSGRTGR